MLAGMRHNYSIRFCYSLIYFEILAKEVDTIIFKITNFICRILFPAILRMVDNFKTAYF